MAKRIIKYALIGISVLVFLFGTIFFIARARFKRPYYEIVTESETETELVYSVMKAESGFCETAVSKAGAVGLMQLMPSTAKFICERENIPFDAVKLYEGEYNLRLGCKYLNYLLAKFEVTETAVAAYNAGEGTVERWLTDRSCSKDGKSLFYIPYQETREYVKKVCAFRKCYKFLY